MGNIEYKLHEIELKSLKKINKKPNANLLTFFDIEAMWHFLSTTAQIVNSHHHMVFSIMFICIMSDNCMFS